MWTTKKPINTHKIKKILIIQFFYYSEVFLSSVIFETLKKNFPEARLYYLVQQPNQIPVIDHPFIDNIISYPVGKGYRYFTSKYRLLEQVRSLKFDLIIDFQTNFTSSMVTLFSGANYRICYKTGKINFVYNYKVEKEFDNYLACQSFGLLKPLGLEYEQCSFYFTINEKSIDFIDEWIENNGLIGKEFIVVVPGSPVAKRKWRLSYYANLCDLIHQDLGLSVVLLWGPGERKDSRFVNNHAINKHIMAPETSLNQAAALLKRAKLLVCNDNGLAHISTTTETKTIEIFGTTNPALRSPASIFATHHYLFKENFPSEKDNSFGISPADVMAKIKEII